MFDVPRLLLSLPLLAVWVLLWVAWDQFQVEPAQSAIAPEFLPGQPISEANTPDKSETSAWVSTDGLTLFFSRDNLTGSNADIEIYRMVRPTLSSPFASAAVLGGLRDVPYNICPWLTPDELTLYCESSLGMFAINPRGIYRATRANTASPFSGWTELSELRTAVPGQDISGCSLTGDQLMIMFSSSAGEIYEATRLLTSQPFNSPQPVGEINSASQDIFPSMTRDGLRVFFSRVKNPLTVTIWYSERTARNQPFDPPVQITSIQPTSPSYMLGIVYFEENTGSLIYAQVQTGVNDTHDLYMALPAPPTPTPTLTPTETPTATPTFTPTPSITPTPTIPSLGTKIWKGLR